MPKPRAPRVSALWKKYLCDGQGNLHGDAQLMVSDLAKFCRYDQVPTRHAAATGAVDPLATMEAIGMHKMLRRILSLTNLDEARANRLALIPWQPDEEDRQI